MKSKFNQTFKTEAVKKVLNRRSGTTVGEVAANLGVAESSLYKWVELARRQELEPLVSSPEKEKSPNDWTLEERLNLVIRCSSLKPDQVNTTCREVGIYPHHFKQWKHDFSTGGSAPVNAEERLERKKLKQENQALKKELRRKEKALAEVAALLVLQKKAQALWSHSDEDDLQ
jgi:transposase